MIHALEPLVVEFEPVVEGAGGEHEDSSEAENDVGDDREGIGDCAED